MPVIAPRPCDPSPARRITVVISGGGVRCAAALGLAQVLARERLPIHLLVGCGGSQHIGGGALFAALLSLGLPTPQVAAWIPRLWTHHLTRQRSEQAALLAMLQQHTNAATSANPSQTNDARQHALALTQVFGDTRIEDTPIPLMITAADARTGAQAVFTRGRLQDVILASHARPFEMAPWMHDGSQYRDGVLSAGHAHENAVGEALAGDVVLCLGFGEAVEAVDADTALPEHAAQAEAYLNSLLGKSLVSQHSGSPLQALHQAPYAVQRAARHGAVIPVLPELEQPIGWFDYAKIPSLVAQGERAAQAILPQLYERLHAPCTTAPAGSKHLATAPQDGLSGFKEKAAFTHTE